MHWLNTLLDFISGAKRREAELQSLTTTAYAAMLAARKAETGVLP